MGVPRLQNDRVRCARIESTRSPPRTRCAHEQGTLFLFTTLSRCCVSSRDDSCNLLHSARASAFIFHFAFHFPFCDLAHRHGHVSRPARCVVMRVVYAVASRARLCCCCCARSSLCAIRHCETVRSRRAYCITFLH
jgi:hypothetical protein